MFGICMCMYILQVLKLYAFTHAYRFTNIDRQRDRQIKFYVDTVLSRKIDEWMDGWTDGQIDGRMDG